MGKTNPNPLKPASAPDAPNPPDQSEQTPPPDAAPQQQQQQQPNETAVQRLRNAVAEPIPAACPDCGATGFTSRHKTTFCPTCKGRGAIEVQPAQTVDCGDCEATGFTEPGVHCPKCAMTGKIVKQSAAS